MNKDSHKKNKDPYEEELQELRKSLKRNKANQFYKQMFHDADDRYEDGYRESIL